jgi:cysteine desulfurase
MDNHATTPVDPRVVEEMLPFFTEKFGNPASGNHAYGWEAQQAVEHARARVARLLHARPNEIVFTSGATESNNLAIKGVAEMCRDRDGHVVTCVTEHKSVLDTCRRLETQGFSVTYLRVQSDGIVDLDDLRNAITDKTILVTIMVANNEIGVIQSFGETAKLCRERGVLFHTDATQAIGKIPLNVEEQGIDLLSLTAHKIYGPKGAGALYVRAGSSAGAKEARVRIAAQLDGGGHERGMRSGTLNVPGIVGLGKACDLLLESGPEESCRLAGLRNRLRDQILTGLDEVHINGSMEHRLPGNLNLSFGYVDGESLMMGISEVAVSSGSACATALAASSHVLRALGMPDDLVHSAIRFGLGRFNTQDEVDYVAARVIETVKQLRELSPEYEAAKKIRN